MSFSHVFVASGFSRKITLPVLAGVLLFLPPEGGSHEIEKQPLFVESAESTGLKFTHVNGAVRLRQ
jgi:hypothetical protein